MRSEAETLRARVEALADQYGDAAFHGTRLAAWTVEADLRALLAKEIFCGDPYIHEPHDRCLGVRQHENSLIRPDRDWTLPAARMPGVCTICGGGPDAWCEATCTAEEPYWPPLIKKENYHG